MACQKPQGPHRGQDSSGMRELILREPVVLHIPSTPRWCFGAAHRKVRRGGSRRVGVPGHVIGALRRARVLTQPSLPIAQSAQARLDRQCCVTETREGQLGLLFFLSKSTSTRPRKCLPPSPEAEEEERDTRQASGCRLEGRRGAPPGPSLRGRGPAPDLRLFRRIKASTATLGHQDSLCPPLT